MFRWLKKLLSYVKREDKSSRLDRYDPFAIDEGGCHCHNVSEEVNHYNPLNVEEDIWIPIRPGQTFSDLIKDENVIPEETDSSEVS